MEQSGRRFKDFAGIKYFAVYYPNAKPRREIVVFVGESMDTKTLYFETRDKKNTIRMTVEEVLAGIKNQTFLPFLLCTEKVRANLFELGEEDGEI